MTQTADKGKSTSIAAPISLDVQKIASKNAPNLNSFSGVRTTVNSAKEGRLKVDAGKGSMKKRAIAKKLVGKYK